MDLCRSQAGEVADHSAGAGRVKDDGWGPASFTAPTTRQLAKRHRRLIGQLRVAGSQLGYSERRGAAGCPLAGSELARSSGGRATFVAGTALVVFDDDRVERWTRVGRRMVVE